MAVNFAQNSIAANTQSITTGGSSAGVSQSALDQPKDRTEPQTAPQFGELLQGIQAKFGARPEKPREIKKTLGKDDFLRIMITQMKNQDPTNPFKAEQMAAQMAQFTSVEQLKNMNDSLVKMSSQNQPLEKLAMTGLIGKNIVIDRGRFPHTEGQGDQLSFGLPRPAEEATVEIINEQGETVFAKDLGKTKAGEVNFSWDGKKANTLPAKSGNYIMRVTAKDEKGQAIDTRSQTQSRVIGVSYEGAEPVFLVGDANRQEKVTMKNVVRIDGAGAPSTEAGAAPISRGPSSSDPGTPSVGSGVGQTAGPAFFSFQKGVGSSNLDVTQLPDVMKKAISQYQKESGSPPESQGSAQEKGAQVSGERGFPNGLNSEEDESSSQERR